MAKPLDLCAGGVSLAEAVVMGGAGPAQLPLQLPDLLLQLGAQVGLIGGFDLIQCFLGRCLGLGDKRVPSCMNRHMMSVNTQVIYLVNYSLF